LFGGVFDGSKYWIIKDGDDKLFDYQLFELELKCFLLLKIKISIDD
jgi:hypothetical protein